MDFFRIYFDLILFKKKCKKGVLYLHMTRGVDVAHGTRADATWHARPRGSVTRTHVLRWHERVAGPCKSTLTPGCRHVVVWEAGRWWAHGLVGPSKSIGAVTQSCYATLPYILTKFTDFFRVGLCSREI